MITPEPSARRAVEPAVYTASTGDLWRACTAEGCGHAGPIDSDFGWRNCANKNNTITVRSQPQCRPCRSGRGPWPGLAKKEQRRVEAGSDLEPGSVAVADQPPAAHRPRWKRPVAQPQDGAPVAAAVDAVAPRAGAAGDDAPRGAPVAPGGVQDDVGGGGGAPEGGDGAAVAGDAVTTSTESWLEDKDGRVSRSLDEPAPALRAGGAVDASGKLGGGSPHYIRTQATGKITTPGFIRTALPGAVATPLSAPSPSVPHSGNQYVYAEDPGVRLASGLRGSTRGLAEPSSTIRDGNRTGPALGRRRITAEECAAIQAFPPDYPWQGTKTTQYRQVGNAVPPPLARAVVQAVIDAAPGIRTAASLFSGAGGADLGMRQAGLEHVFGIEWEKDAAATAVAAGFPVVLGDVRSAEHYQNRPGVDLLWASPPCQDWSAAGERKGASGERNGWPWTWEAIDALRAAGSGPTWLLAENVPGLLQHKSSSACKKPKGWKAPATGWPEWTGPRFCCLDPAQCPAAYFHEVILTEARKRFAWVTYWVLDAADFGVPQNRVRVFLAAGPHAVEAPRVTHGDPKILREGDSRKPWMSVKEALGALHLAVRAHGKRGFVEADVHRPAPMLGAGSHRDNGFRVLAETTRRANPNGGGWVGTISDITNRPAPTVPAGRDAGAGPWIEESTPPQLSLFDTTLGAITAAGFTATTPTKAP